MLGFMHVYICMFIYFKNSVTVSQTLKLTSSRPLQISSLIGGNDDLSAWNSTTARNEFYSKTVSKYKVAAITRSKLYYVYV